MACGRPAVTCPCPLPRPPPWPARRMPAHALTTVSPPVHPRQTAPAAAPANQPAHPLPPRAAGAGGGGAAGRERGRCRRVGSWRGEGGRKARGRESRPAAPRARRAPREADAAIHGGGPPGPMERPPPNRRRSAAAVDTLASAQEQRSLTAVDTHATRAPHPRRTRPHHPPPPLPPSSAPPPRHRPPARRRRRRRHQPGHLRLRPDAQDTDGSRTRRDGPGRAGPCRTGHKSTLPECPPPPQYPTLPPLVAPDKVHAPRPSHTAPPPTSAQSSTPTLCTAT